MSVYQIVKNGDAILREKAKEITVITGNVIKLLDNLRDTLADAGNGVGLAAPQIGISKQAIVIDTGDEYLELINPVIISGEGSEVDTEGCLSVPGLMGDVARYTKVQVNGLNREGQPVSYTREGFLARVLQHEIDHLEGTLFIDKAENLRPMK